MLKPLKKTKNEGFTIIEVMIVLAIAGLILLIVFLAVPALQRNSRNTQAKNEAANLLGAINEHVSNNNGKLPTSTDAANIITAAKVSNITTLTIEGATGSTAPTNTTAVMRTSAKCPTTASTTTNVTTLAGAARQFALVYLIENASGPIASCIDS